MNGPVMQVPFYMWYLRRNRHLPRSHFLLDSFLQMLMGQPFPDLCVPDKDSFGLKTRSMAGPGQSVCLSTCPSLHLSTCAVTQC